VLQGCSPDLFWRSGPGNSQTLALCGFIMAMLASNSITKDILLATVSRFLIQVHADSISNQYIA
jgi:hypothetical protein